MRKKRRLWIPPWRTAAIVAAGGWTLFVGGCKTTGEWRDEADKKAVSVLEQAQQKELGRSEVIEVESPADSLRRRLLLDQRLPQAAKASLGIRDIEDNDKWIGTRHIREGKAYSSKWNTEKPICISLGDAIIIAAANSREYQNQKDALFQAALALDLEEHEFQNTFTGMLRSTFSSSHDGERRNNGLTNNATAGIARTFKNGAELAASLSVDLVKMLTGSHGSSWGVSGDASISIPLLRGSGEFIVTESLTSAQRNLVYEIRRFEQYKRSFVVTVATNYLGVLQAGQRIKNQEDNYKRVVTSTRRSRRMADSGRLPNNQLAEAVQNELSARDSWISALQSYQTTLDTFKVQLGLPPDAKVEPDVKELDKLLKDGETLGGGGTLKEYEGNTPSADAPVDLTLPDSKDAGPSEIDETKAITLAFERRPDLRNYLEQIWDAQRQVLIAEDALRAELTLGGAMSVGEGRSLGQANSDNGDFRVNRASYSAPLRFDFAWERTRERNNYRNSLISLERTVRTFQAQEDSIKQSIRSKLRSLLEKRSSVVIQRLAVELAISRVNNTSLLLEAGRAEMRDVLDAQGALLSAQNSQISALVSYRLNELELQRDLGVLSVTADGLFSEMDLSSYK